MNDTQRLRAAIRDVADFPKPGVVFKDITPLLQDPELLQLSCDLLAEPFRDRQVSLVLGVESRGFIFGPPVALALGAGFQIARKPGKLPWDTIAESYELEYGKGQIEIHRDAVQPGQRVLLLDDVIATGGTAAAAARLATRMGAEVVGCAFLIELDFLGGRQKLGNLEVHSVLCY
ncbi:MAG: adenine phosphoribosyltransferase [Myxococcales bacterium]|nr:adenine phosphoribosyltransferase [Myxococcales bacterium]